MAQFIATQASQGIGGIEHIFHCGVSQNCENVASLYIDSLRELVPRFTM